MAKNNEKTPVEIFSEISAELNERAEFDSELTKVICDNILVVGDEPDAVENALEAIEKLARQRAGIEE